MNNLRAIGIAGLLVLYPLLAYLSRTQADMSMDYLLAMLGYGLFGLFFFEKLFKGETLRVPYYLTALGIFALYKMASAMLISDLFMTAGVFKYFYSDPFFGSFFLLLVIENTRFSPKMIRYTAKGIFAMLLLAGVVIAYQIIDPLFFYDPALVGSNGMDFDRWQEYLKAHPELSHDNVTRLMDGYRFSIYSWSSELSVGLDSMALFSLLFAMASFGTAKRAVVWGVAGLISFLSNSRWIMLNFLVVSFQEVLVKRNRLLNALKYLGFVAFIVVLAGYTAMALGVDIEKFIYNRLLDRGANTRIYAFEVFGKVFPKAPIFGTGGADTPEMLRLLMGKTSQIHVGWLKLLYYYGIVGTVLYLIFAGLLMQQLRQRARKHNYWGPYFAFVAFFLANCTLVELDIFYHGLLLAILFSNATFKKAEITVPAQQYTSVKPIQQPSHDLHS